MSKQMTNADHRRLQLACKLMRNAIEIVESIEQRPDDAQKEEIQAKDCLIPIMEETVLEECDEPF